MNGDRQPENRRISGGSNTRLGLKEPPSTSPIFPSCRLPGNVNFRR
jgi:hypothetical protein